MVKVPNFLQPYLASYNLTKLDISDPGVDREIITEVLNRGDKKAVRWVFSKFSNPIIKSAIKNPAPGTWLESSLSYWQKILGVSLSDKKFREGVLNLNPYVISRNFKSKSA
ncbi:MAG: hypothetical protein AAB546_00005 [Patescibacteria group bacterium]